MAKQTNKTSTKKASTKKAKGVLYYEAVGRRKQAVCRIRLYISSSGTVTLGGDVIKKGEVHINGVPAGEYFPGKVNERLYQEPYSLTNTVDRFCISAKIFGGGKKGQLSAFRLASARALQKADEELRKILKPEGLLTVDARVRERRKAGLAGKARKEKQSPKR